MFAHKLLRKHFALCGMMSVLFLSTLPAEASAQTDWQLKKDEDGIKVYTGRLPNTCFKAIKVECKVNASLSQLIAFLLDVSKQNDWVYSNKNSELIKKIAPNEIIFYAEVNVPWPCTNRDYVSHIIIHQQTHDSLNIEAYTEVGLIPEKSGKVRVKNSHAHWEITTIDKDVQKIVYTVQFDPAGALPAWLVNIFVTKGPLQTFQKLRSCINKPEYLHAHADFIK